MKVETLNDFNNLSPILYLLHFIIYKNLDIRVKSSSFTENYNTIYKYCLKLKIPFVLEWNTENETTFIYQLQFIYNVIENSLALRFIDDVKKFKAKIQKVHVPAFSKLADSVKAKSLFMKLQDDKSNENLNVECQRKVPKPTLFKERCQCETINSENIIVDDEIGEVEKIDFLQNEEDQDLFWNKVPDSNFANLNGIIVENENEKNNQFKNEWNKEIESLPKVETNNPSAYFSVQKYSFETKLFKYPNVTTE